MANEIKTKITADSSQLQAETKKAEASVKGLVGTIQGVEDQLQSVAKTAGIAFGALVGAAGLSIKAFRDSEKATQELDIALRNAGLSSQRLVGTYRDYAAAVQEVTGVDDDAIVAAQAKLQTYLGQKEITEELTLALVDLSTQTGSLETAADQLGKAYLGNVTAFQKQKIQIDENADAETRLQQAVDGVNARIGGRAQALASGLGVLNKLKTSVGDLAEEFGKRLAPLVTRGAEALLGFVQAISKNKPLLDFITNVALVGGALAGLIATGAGVALAVLKIGSAVSTIIPIIRALGITAGAATAATGIGALLLVIPLVITYFNELKAVAVGALVTVGKAFQSFGGILNAVVSGDFKKIQSEFENLKNSLSEGIKAGKVEFERGKQPEQPAFQDASEEQKRAAKESADELKRQNDIKAQINNKSNAVAILQAKQASEDLIKIKQQELEILKQLETAAEGDQRTALEARLKANQALQRAYGETEAEDRRKVAEQLLEENVAFQALNDEQKAAFREKALQDLQAGLDSEQAARRKAIQDTAAEQARANNEYLKNQQQFGTVYAEINKAIYNAQVQSAARGFSELTQLQQSNNAALKAIGKAAAVADITIKTAQSAMNIYTAFSAIPFIGPALGVAGAAAAVAFGAEQIGRVLSAKEGGVVPGLNMGMDRTPALLQPGELVVPAQNFDQVVQAVASQQQSLDAEQAPQLGSPASGGSGMIQIGFDGAEAEKVLTARRVEARALGTLRESQA